MSTSKRSRKLFLQRDSSSFTFWMWSTIGRLSPSSQCLCVVDQNSFYEASREASIVNASRLKSSVTPLFSALVSPNLSHSMHTHATSGYMAKEEQKKPTVMHMPCTLALSRVFIFGKSFSNSSKKAQPSHFQK